MLISNSEKFVFNLCSVVLRDAEVLTFIHTVDFIFWKFPSSVVLRNAEVLTLFYVSELLYSVGPAGLENIQSYQFAFPVSVAMTEQSINS